VTEANIGQGENNYRLWFPYYGRSVHQQLVLTSPPAVEPVTRVQAKQWAVVEHEMDDQIFDNLITGARIQVENWLERSLITQTWTLYMDGFNTWEYELQRPPVQSVTSINYIDTNGDQQLIDPSIYVVDNSTEPTRIRPQYNMVWPVWRTQIPNPIWTVFVAGYGNSAASVPLGIQQAILELVTFRYRNREPLTMSANVAQVEADIRSRVMTYSWGSYI
jgi:uncharacterized phiE125 gp8 family phage protein